MGLMTSNPDFQANLYTGQVRTPLAKATLKTIYDMLSNCPKQDVMGKSNVEEPEPATTAGTGVAPTYELRT